MTVMMMIFKKLFKKIFVRCYRCTMSAIKQKWKSQQPLGGSKWESSDELCENVTLQVHYKESITTESLK